MKSAVKAVLERNGLCGELADRITREVLMIDIEHRGDMTLDHTARKDYSEIIASFDTDAPTPLWRWITMIELCSVLGFEETKEAAMHIGRALSHASFSTRKSNGRKLRFVPPLKTTTKA